MTKTKKQVEYRYVWNVGGGYEWDRFSTLEAATKCALKEAELGFGGMVVKVTEQVIKRFRGKRQ